MKLMVVSPYFYPKIGGLENYAYNIGKGLHEKYNWEVVVVTSNNEGKKYKEEIINGFKIYRLPYWFKISNTPINPLWFFQIRKIIKKEKPDVINAHIPVPFIADITSIIKGSTPFTLTYHGDMYKKKPIINFIVRLYEQTITQLSLRIANKIICTSNYYVGKSRTLSKFKNKIEIVSPGVDTNKYYSNPHIRRVNNQILFVGQLDKEHEYKGLTVLLDAIKLLTDRNCFVSLHIAGDGNYRNFYQEYTRKKGISKIVKFHGRITEKELIFLYRQSAVTVLPSLNNSEGFGMVLLESGACGTPVVGTHVGGIPSIIENNKTGLLIPPKDKHMLAEAIVYLLNNPQKADIFGNNASKKIKEKYSWDQQIEKTHKLFINLVKI